MKMLLRNPRPILTDKAPTLERGFTFVEVIAVGVIVAILAAVAIPVYSGYVTSQRKEVAKNLAKTGAVNANVFYRRHGTAPSTSDLNLYLPDATRYSVQISGNYVIVSDNMGSRDIVKDSATYR